MVGWLCRRSNKTLFKRQWKSIGERDKLGVLRNCRKSKMNAGEIQYVAFLGHIVKSLGDNFSTSTSLVGAGYLWKQNFRCKTNGISMAQLILEFVILNFTKSSHLHIPLYLQAGVQGWMDTLRGVCWAAKHHSHAVEAASASCWTSASMVQKSLSQCLEGVSEHRILGPAAQQAPLGRICTCGPKEHQWEHKMKVLRDFYSTL